METNVKEVLEFENEEDDALFRLLMDLQSPRWQLGRSLGLDGRVRGGLDLYNQFIEESRWLAEGRLRGQWSLGRGRRLSLRGSAFRQSYPDSTSRDFYRYTGDIGYRAPVGSKWTAGVSLDLHARDYRQTPWHDESGWGVRLSAARTIRSSIAGEAQFRLGGDSFGRKSLKARRVENQTIFELGPDQKDSYRSLGVSFQRVRPFVTRVGYTYSSRRSNSYGFSYRRHDFRLLASVALPWDMDFQALGTLQITQYTDAGIDSVFVLRSGEEVEGRDTNNSLTLRVRRPLWDGPMLELRWAWYRNESLLVDRYYSKWLLGVSVRWGIGRGV